MPWSRKPRVAARSARAAQARAENRPREGAIGQGTPALTSAIQALLENGDAEGAERIRAQLVDVEKAIADVDYRAANARAGYAYVISNIGAFGERMIKVGMTRRLEPRDRIRELSDASVPNNFDIHASFSADDAEGIEAEMHRRLAAKRVNMVDLRREYFYATPADARDLLAELAGELLEFEEAPEAVEFHQSQNTCTETKHATPPRCAMSASPEGFGIKVGARHSAPAPCQKLR